MIVIASRSFQPSPPPTPKPYGFPRMAWNLQVSRIHMKFVLVDSDFQKPMKQSVLAKMSDTPERRA